MNKVERQELIAQIITQRKVKKQEEIVSALAEKGLDITQATVSRDIQDMHLVKLSSESGDSYYSLPLNSVDTLYQEIKKILADSFLSIDIQRDMLYIKTIPGSGDALSNAISQRDLPQIFAVVSNDDSVLIVCKSEELAKEMRDHIINLI